MKRVMNLIVPHLVFWMIVGLILLSGFYRELPIVVNGILLCIGICLIIFAKKIGFWWKEGIDEQRKARKILYDWYIRVSEAWVFRVFGITLSLLAVYHLYIQYTSMTNTQGLDNKSVSGIMLNILLIFNLIWWWSNAKGTPYRKTIVIIGICWIVTLITFLLALWFNIIAVAPITLIAGIAFIYFFIKALIEQRRYRTEN